MNVLKEQDGFRVVLIQDDSMPEPDYDGESPLLRIDPDRSCAQAEYVNKGDRPDDSDDRIAAFAVHLFNYYRQRDALKILERALKFATGATQVETYWSDSYWYVTYDAADWREAVGAPEGGAGMSEYKAWINGEVYGYAIQKLVAWVPEGGGDARMATWESVEDEGCWGFYGYEYAESEALEAFRAFLNPGGIPE